MNDDEKAEAVPSGCRRASWRTARRRMQRSRAWARLKALLAPPPGLTQPDLEVDLPSNEEANFMQSPRDAGSASATSTTHISGIWDAVRQPVPLDALPMAATYQPHSKGILDVLHLPTSLDTHLFLQAMAHSRYQGAGESFSTALPACESDVACGSLDTLQEPTPPHLLCPDPIGESEVATNSATEETTEASAQSESATSNHNEGLPKVVNVLDMVYDAIEKCTRKMEVGLQPAWMPVMEALRPFREGDTEVNDALEEWERLGVIEFVECVRFSRHAVRPEDRPLRCYVCGLPRPGPPRALASGRSGFEGKTTE